MTGAREDDARLHHVISDNRLQRTRRHRAEDVLPALSRRQPALQEWMWRILPREGAALEYQRRQVQRLRRRAHIRARQHCVHDCAAVAKRTHATGARRLAQ